MSTSISMFVERRDGDTWVPAQRTYEHVTPWGSGSYKDTRVVEEDAVDPGQHYRLFAILAGVRDRDGHIKPIAEYRGLPDDASEFIRHRIDHACEPHCATHFTVRELLDYDWDSQSVSDSGFVTKEEAERIKREGGAPSECRFSAYNEFTEEVTWTQTMRQECDYFLTTVLPSLAKFGDLNSLRLVMWFD